MVKLVIVVVAVLAASAHASTERSYEGDMVTPGTQPLPKMDDDACEQQVVKCMGPLLTGAGNYTMGGPELWTAAQLREHCNQLNTSERCVAESPASCRDMVEEQSQVFFQMMNFICHNVFDDLVQLSSCAESQNTQRDIQQCVRKIMQAQAGLVQSNDFNPQCRLIGEYEQCVVNAESKCGEEAAQLYVSIFDYLNGIISQHINCTAAGGMIGTDDDEDPPQSEVLDEEMCAEVISGCLEPLEPHRKGFTSFQLETIPQVCSDFNLVLNCVDETAHACEETPEWNIIEEAFSQICQSEITEGVSSCPVRQDVVTKLKSCERDELKGDIEMEDDETCQVIEDYVNCYSITVDRECEEKDGQLVSQVMTGVAQVIQLDKEVICEDTLPTTEPPESSEAEAEPGSDVLVSEGEELCISAATTCLQDLESHREAMVDFDVSTLPEICRVFSAAKTCMDKIAAKCEPAVQWQALEQSFAAICNPNALRVLGQGAGCLRKPSLGRKLENCESTELQSEQDMDDSQICQVMSEYLECYEAAVNEECPANVSDALDEVFDGVSGIIQLEKDVDCEAVLAGGMIGTDDDEDPPQTEVLDEEMCAEVISGCLEPLEPHRKGFTSFQLETIPQVCSDFNLVLNCVDETAHACEETPEWNIIEEAFSQICQSEITEGVSDCPQSQDVVTKLKSCERDELKGDIEMEDDETCQVIEDYVNCYSITVDRECEEKDGQLVSQVMTGVAQVIQLDKEVICEDTLPTTEPPESSERDMIGDLDDHIEQQFGALSPCMEDLADVQITSLPVHKYESLDELCMKFDEAKVCGQETLDTEYVSEEIRGYWDELMMVAKYMCHEKRAEFREVYSCMARQEEEVQSVCYNTVQMEDSEGEEKTVCRMVENFEECSVATVKESCGDKAGRLVKGLLDKTNNLLAKDYHINCPFMFKSRLRLILGLSIGGGVLLVLAVVTIACVIHRRRYRSHTLDKKELVKHDILQTNIQIGLQDEKKSKNSDVATLSVSKLHI